MGSLGHQDPTPYLVLKFTNFFYSFPKGGRIHDIHGYLKIYEGCFIYRQRLDAEAGEVGHFNFEHFKSQKSICILMYVIAVLST